MLSFFIDQMCLLSLVDIFVLDIAKFCKVVFVSGF